MSVRRGFLVKVLVWLLAIGLLIGCQGDSLNGPGATTTEGQTQSSAQEEIGQSSTSGLIGDLLGRILGWVTGIVTPVTGGTLNLLNSQFVVPPLAVLTPTMITWVLRAETPAGLPGALNRVYYFSPDGLVFLIPSTLYVSFTDAGLGSNNPYQYTCFYYNASLQRWEPQPTSVDIANQRFVVTISHFSCYAFGR